VYVKIKAKNKEKALEMARKLLKNPEIVRYERLAPVIVQRQRYLIRAEEVKKGKEKKLRGMI
jgi:phosphoribosylformylglycinamidine (FGAM) synthase PurS component